MKQAKASVLYDAPGPRAQRVSLIAGVPATAVLAWLVFIAVGRLDRGGQLAWELWAPLLDPGHASFTALWVFLGKGLLATLKAAALAIAFSGVLGVVLGITRVMSGKAIRVPLVGISEVFRGLPVVVSIYLASRVLPELGVNLTGMPGGEGLWFLVIGLVMYNTVVIAEIVRAGIAAVPRGQSEAGQSVGLGAIQSMRLVVLPQAIRVMLPALVSQMIVIVKDTSLAAVLGLYPELLRAAKAAAQELHNPFVMYVTVGLIFIALNYVLSLVAQYLNRRASRMRVG